MEEKILGSEKNFIFKEMTEVLGHDFINKPFVFNGFMFGVCTKGNIRIKINYKEYYPESKWLFVVPPNHIFSVMEYSHDFEAKVLFVSMDVARDIPLTPDFGFLRNIGDNPCVKLSDDKEEDIVKLYSVINRYGVEDESSRLIRNTLILSLILIAVSMYDKSIIHESTYSRQEEITKRFFELLFEYYMVERTVAFYADKLCVTPKYFSMSVKSVTGFPVQDWINEVVLFEAKRLLKTTKLSIRQVSDKLNFPDASSFVRFFRSHIGSTPLAFRKNE